MSLILITPDAIQEFIKLDRYLGGLLQFCDCFVQNAKT
jgi:hypothetical protein